jgi:hypothetical protein
VRVFPRPGCITLIATDQSDRYECMSVTNSVEYLAAELCTAYEIPPEELLLIEHYDDREMIARMPLHIQARETNRPGRTNAESFDLVTVTGGTQHWKRITKEEAERLAGEPLA